MTVFNLQPGLDFPEGVSISERECGLKYHIMVSWEVSD